MIKYADESQSCPQKSPQVPPNMVQYTGTIVRDRWRWRTKMYKTERLGLVLTPAEKTAVVQMAEAEGGLSQSSLVRRLIRCEKEPGHSPRLSVIHCACLPLQPRVLLLDHALVQLLEQRCRRTQQPALSLSKGLPRWQFTIPPGLH
jgi:hypothetical protein